MSDYEAIDYEEIYGDEAYDEAVDAGMSPWELPRQRSYGRRGHGRSVSYYDDDFFDDDEL